MYSTCRMYSMYTCIQCVMCTVHATVCVMYCTCYSVRYVLYMLQCVICTVNATVCDMYCTLYSVRELCTVFPPITCHPGVHSSTGCVGLLMLNTNSLHLIIMNRSTMNGGHDPFVHQSCKCQRSNRLVYAPYFWAVNSQVHMSSSHKPPSFL